jgi:hypothetical protein
LLWYNELPANELLGIELALHSGDLVEPERADEGTVECVKGVGFEHAAANFALQLESVSGY